MNLFGFPSIEGLVSRRRITTAVCHSLWKVEEYSSSLRKSSIQAMSAEISRITSHGIYHLVRVEEGWSFRADAIQVWSRCGGAVGQHACSQIGFGFELHRRLRCGCQFLHIKCTQWIYAWSSLLCRVCGSSQQKHVEWNANQILMDSRSSRSTRLHWHVAERIIAEPDRSPNCAPDDPTG